MKKRNPQISRNSSTRKQQPSAFSWKYFFLTAVCAVGIAAGLFFAATRHFSSMELSIANAKLRSQLQELSNERRRLELAREIALTPHSLKETARTLGFREVPTLRKGDEVGEKPEMNQVTGQELAAATTKIPDKATVSKTQDIPVTPQPTRTSNAIAENRTDAKKPNLKESKASTEKPAKAVRQVEETRPRIVAIKTDLSRDSSASVKRTSISSQSGTRKNEARVVKF